MQERMSMVRCVVIGRDIHNNIMIGCVMMGYLRCFDTIGCVMCYDV